jgi:Rrf2 family nitric oxide-sensitive transcriptional repressor
MRLAERTDDALRVLLLLAADPDRISVVEMAARLNVSANHLAKVVQLLQAEGWVETMPGRGGGERLAATPSELTAGEVVRAIEPDFHIVECFKEESCCPLYPECRPVDFVGDNDD